ncbi:MAG: translocation/assembly module TamB domain-containing protein [Vicinamibacterales bacterium]
MLRLTVAALLLLLVAAGVGVTVLRSAWGQDRVRALLVTQANRFLTGTLAIDRIEGTLIGGVTLHGVRLIQDGVAVVSINTARVDYGIRELYEGGTTIRRLRLNRLHLIVDRGDDGRWNLGRLVRPRPPREPDGRPPRVIAFPDVELIGSTVEFRDPLLLGAAHVPTRIEDLDAKLAVEWQGPAWRVDVTRATWWGHAPELKMLQLAGSIGTDDRGWAFDRLQVETPASRFTVTGTTRRQPTSSLALTVSADRFSFQEWGGVLTGLRNIAVESTFSASLDGPLNRLATTLDLKSTGGAVRGRFVLDSTVPGWHGAGVAEVTRLDVSRWFNRPDRPSDITGRLDFDLDLGLGRRFPRGSYTFTGPHAAYVGYAADSVRARGTLTATEALISQATMTAYGADVRVASGAIGIDAPYHYRFDGRAAGVDLRRLPPGVPLPHVESTLVLDYRVRGQFVPGTLVGDAVFGVSDFLGATIGEGAVGSIDTTTTPVEYAGDGEVHGISLDRFGAGLDVAWMRQPRYAGTVNGRFRVRGHGSEAATMMLDGGGRLTQASLFGGELRDADVAVRVEDGRLSGTYDGRFVEIDPARALDDPRWQASLTGDGRLRFGVADLLVRDVTLADYTIDAEVALAASTVRGVAVERATMSAHLAEQSLRISTLALTGPRLEVNGRGTIELDGTRQSAFDVDLVRGDLVLLAERTGGSVAGQLSTAGRLTGPIDRPRLTGNGRITRLTAAGMEVLTGGFAYDVTMPPDQPADAVGRVSGAVGPLTLGGQAVNEISFAATYDRGAASLDLRGTRAGGLNGSLVSVFTVDPARRRIDVSRLGLQVQDVIWRLADGAAPQVGWDDAGVTIADLAITDTDTQQQQLLVQGDWRPSAGGQLRVRASRLLLDTVSGLVSQPPRFGGRLDADAIIRPADAKGQPVVTGTFSIRDGRIRRLGYDRLAATVGYDQGVLTLDARLDQAPGVWLTAIGQVPLALFIDGQPDVPMRVAVASSPIDLGLVEGLTDTVRDVTGRLQVNVTAIGSAADPHFEGNVALDDGAFVVRATGARYRNARLDVALARDVVAVRSLHVEDERGRPVDVTGSLGTHELRVGDLAVTARARQFTVMRNEFGTTQVDADLDLRGQFESPRLTGTLSVTGGELNVSEIIDRVLLRPYATTASAELNDNTIPIDPLVALNPWERMGLDLAVRTPGTLRMVGDNVQVSVGTPLGLGNVNMRAFGEVYLYKDPGQPLFVTGSLDSLVGSYSFQGRRFDLDPGSSILFRGDLTPELYVTVQRTISGVDTRVSIVGPLTEPELRLASTPPMDDSNILSLIVFNTTINELSGAQQQELAVRAGTLAAGFLATPLVTALERSLGLDILEIELQPGGPVASTTPSPRVTVGDEIAPGLVARFSRQFGSQEYSEASLEYFLSRLFRVRATFSDAGTMLARSPFRRVERAGIDLLLFFSF